MRHSHPHRCLGTGWGALRGGERGGRGEERRGDKRAGERGGDKRAGERGGEGRGKESKYKAKIICYKYIHVA